MKTRKSLRWGLFLLFAGIMSAAEGGGADVVLVADSRHLSGITGWWANLFNESHFYFAVLTVIVIPVAGVILGTAADLLMGRLGINLKSRSLREG